MRSPSLWDGPGRDRTCDLGIKSPGGTPAAGGNKLNLAATAAVRLCNKLQLNAGSGDKPVLSAVLAIVGFTGNEAKDARGSWRAWPKGSHGHASIRVD